MTVDDLKACIDALGLEGYACLDRALEQLAGAPDFDERDREWLLMTRLILAAVREPEIGLDRQIGRCASMRPQSWLRIRCHLTRIRDGLLNQDPMFVPLAAVLGTLVGVVDGRRLDAETAVSDWREELRAW